MQRNVPAELPAVIKTTSPASYCAVGLYSPRNLALVAALAVFSDVCFWIASSFSLITIKSGFAFPFSQNSHQRFLISRICFRKTGFAPNQLWQEAQSGAALSKSSGPPFASGII